MREGFQTPFGRISLGDIIAAPGGGLADDFKDKIKEKIAEEIARRLMEELEKRVIGNGDEEEEGPVVEVKPIYDCETNISATILGEGVESVNFVGSVSDEEIKNYETTSYKAAKRKADKDLEAKLKKNSTSYDCASGCGRFQEEKPPVSYTYKTVKGPTGTAYTTVYYMCAAAIKIRFGCKKTAG